MRRLLYILLCLAGPSWVPAQTPTIRTGTEIVVVDVTVTDSHGSPVHGLKQSDFALTEDGGTQTLTHFEEHIAPTAAQLAKAPVMPKMEPNVYTNFTPVPEDGPLNVLLLDYLNTPMDGQSRARQQLVTFLKGLKPGTRVAIFGLNSRLVMLQGFTSDPQRLLALLTGTKGNPGKSPLLPERVGTETMTDNVGGSTSREDAMRLEQVETMQKSQQQTQRAQITLGAMNVLARYLSSVPGRKNLIWFSASFPISILPDPYLQGRTENYKQNPFSVVSSSADQFRETTRLFGQSQVAVYPVDARGLFTGNLANAEQSIFRNVLNPRNREQDQDTFTNQTFDEQITMKQMAEATGGTAYLNTNNLSEAVEHAIDSGSNYYTVIYSPTNKTHDGGFRKIAVKLAGDKRYTLNYRRGYYSALADGAKPKLPETSGKSSASAPPADPMVAAMQFGAPELNQIVFKAMLVAGAEEVNKLPDGNIGSPKTKPPYRVVTVAYAVNTGDVALPLQTDGNRRVNLRFVAMVYDANGQGVIQQISAVNVIAKPEAYKQFLHEGLRYQQQIAVPAKGEFYVRVGVHDLSGDTVGVLQVPVAGIGKQ